MLFLLTPEALDFAPARCAMVEDAPAGILAARGVAALGVARLGGEVLLREAGANLDRIGLAALAGGILRRLAITEDAPDAIYLLPFCTATWPEAARASLMYRPHTLPPARGKTRQFGYKGALYARESADTGVETMPESVLGPDGTPVEILTGKMEHHISGDVAYAVWQYWRATADDDLFLQVGAQIMLETARCWASRAAAKADGQRHFGHVTDEYPEDVDDDAFTNVMARWNVASALETGETLRGRWPGYPAELEEGLALGEDELADWSEAITRLATGFGPARGVHEQFAGFHALEPVDVASYTDHSVPIDVVLARDPTQRSQGVKQADVVALVALLPEEFPGERGERNFRHYEPLCAHGSSPSASLHALLAARLGDSDMALRYQRDTASLDLDPDPNSAGGVRIAGLGELGQVTVLGLGGIDLTAEMPRIDPRLPPHWRGLSFQIRWRDRNFKVRVAPRSVEVRLRPGEEIGIEIAGATDRLALGGTAQVFPVGPAMPSHARAGAEP